MDLLGRAIIAAVVFAVIVIGAFLLVQKITPPQAITAAEANTTIYNFLESQPYPNIPNITIHSVAPSQFAGSWEVTAYVITNATTPCPNYYVYTFDYPKFGLTNSTQTTYTQDCVVYGSVGSYPAAITKSYDMRNGTAVGSYISKFRYSNVFVTTQYHSSFSVFNENYSNVWVVDYATPSANYSAYMVISQDSGTSLLSYTANK